MLVSMTGFGRSEKEIFNKKIIVEIRTLNGKNSDVNLRIPQQFREKELPFRKIINSFLMRGKIDVFISVDGGSEQDCKINTEIVSSYVSQLNQIQKLSENESLTIAMKLPNVLMQEKEVVSEEEMQVLESTLLEALGKVVSYRKGEGKALEKDFILRIKKLTTLLDEVEKIDPQRKERVEERLSTSIKKNELSVDENRMQQELIYYIEKLDITEEKTRLVNHLDYFSKIMNETEGNGKKLGFITQEIGREINTIGSKANHGELQKIVVQMKDELEKIKEQLSNIL